MKKCVKKEFLVLKRRSIAKMLQSKTAMNDLTAALQS